MMKKIKVVGAERDYTAFIKNGSFLEIGSLLENYHYEEYVIIYDSKVDISPILELKVPKKLLKINTHERAKDVLGADAILTFLSKNEVVKHKTLIIAIGGGVLLDLVGFSSSLYMRGIDVAYIPTTLIAMVDVAIGSKNGIHFKKQKNFLGTFKDPSFTLIDPRFLNTLSQREIKSGLVEIIKMAYIVNDKIMLLLDNIYEKNYNWEPVIYMALTLKNEIIKMDFKDKSIRQYLNFGHTFGHALETYYDYERYTHGEAVAIGMCLAYPSEKLIKDLKKFEINTEMDYFINAKKLYEFMQNDKKRENSNSVKIITLKEMCSPVFDKLDDEYDLVKKIERLKLINEEIKEK